MLAICTFNIHLERVWNEDLYGTIGLIKIELLNTATLQKVLPITNMQKCDNVMLIFWFYTSHFKLILGKSSYLKSLHKGYFLKKFFTLWNTRILEKIHLATMYISISVPKSQIRSLCENGGGSIVFQIWCSPYPRPICQEYEIIMTISK